MADFIVDFTLFEEENIKVMSALWTVHTDGLSVQKMRGVGVVVTSPKEDILKYGVQLQFLATNNEAEYGVILMGLRVVRFLRARNILLKSDSKLVIGQFNGEYEEKENKMK